MPRSEPRSAAVCPAATVAGDWENGTVPPGAAYDPSREVPNTTGKPAGPGAGTGFALTENDEVGAAGTCAGSGSMNTTAARYTSDIRSGAVVACHSRLSSS